MLNSKQILFLTLLLLTSLCQAAKLWEQPEELDYRFTPSISLAGEASDGKVWLLTGLPEWKKFGVFYLERIDAMSGQVLKTAQYYGSVPANYPSIYGASFDTSGGLFIRGIHFDDNLRPTEFTRDQEFALPLPLGRWIADRAPGLGPIAPIRGPGVVDAVYLGGFNSNNASLVASRELGLWSLSSENLIRYMSPINLLNGQSGAIVALPPVCTGAIKVLSERRALANTCIFDTQTGQLISELEPGWVDQFLTSGSGFTVRSKTDMNGVAILQAINIETGALAWEKIVSPSGPAKVVASTLIFPTNQSVVGINVATGAPAFEFAIANSNGARVSIGERFVLVYNTTSVQVRSTEDGSLLRTLNAAEVPAVSDYTLVTADATGVYSAAMFEADGNEVVQFSKRSQATGELIWQKKLVRQVSNNPTFGITDYSGGLDFTVGGNTLVLTWGYTRWKELRTSVISLAADTGDVYARNNYLWLGTVQSGFPNGTGAYAFAAATPKGNMMLNVFDTSAPLGTPSSRLVTNSGAALWNYIGHPVYGGDFVAWDASSIKRLRETDGSVVWSINNPVGQNFRTGYYITESELIFSKGSPWTGPTNKPTIIRINLSTGLITEQNFDFPPGYNSASITRFANKISYTTTDNSFFADDVPAFIVWSSNIGLPVIIAATTRTGAIPINLTSPWPQVVYAGPNVRLRGLTATTYPKLDLDDISFNWSAELRPDFSGPYLWSNLGLTNSNTFPRTERKIIAAQVNRIDQPLFAIDRSFDGEVHKTWIRKSPARLSALPVSLKLEELPHTAAGYGKHTLRVTNTGNIAVQSARLASTKLDSVRFSCSVNAGRCAPQAGEGTMNLELDLAPGASATVELFDALASSGNAVILMAPIDEIEDDVSDNTVGFGARFLSSGFEN